MFSSIWFILMQIKKTIQNTTIWFLQTGELPAAPGIEERIEVSRTHLYKSVEWKEGRLGILEMRKHYSNYFKGLPNISGFRDRLVRLETVDEIEMIFSEMEEVYHGAEAIA